MNVIHTTECKLLLTKERRSCFRLNRSTTLTSYGCTFESWQWGSFGGDEIDSVCCRWLLLWIKVRFWSRVGGFLTEKMPSHRNVRRGVVWSAYGCCYCISHAGFSPPDLAKQPLTAYTSLLINLTIIIMDPSWIEPVDWRDNETCPWNNFYRQCS